jgi:hypothetical protein
MHEIVSRLDHTAMAMFFQSKIEEEEVLARVCIPAGGAYEAILS